MKNLIILLFIVMQGCVVSTYHLDDMRTEAEIAMRNHRIEWNYHNRYRLAAEKRLLARHHYRELELLRAQKRRFLLHPRRSYRGIGSNTYNPNQRGYRRHITKRKYNGVGIHKKNYWSKTTKHPQLERRKLQEHDPKRTQRSEVDNKRRKHKER